MNTPVNSVQARISQAILKPIKSGNSLCRDSWIRENLYFRVRGDLKKYAKELLKIFVMKDEKLTFYMYSQVPIKNKDIKMSHPSNKLTAENLLEIFTYHDDENRIPHYKAIRKAAHDFALAIIENTPDCADRTAALRRVREAVMTANAAVALAPSYPWE